MAVNVLYWGWLASKFSPRHHSCIKHKACENEENDRKLENLLISNKSFLISVIGNVKRAVWRIYMLMLGFKGLNVLGFFFLKSVNYSAAWHEVDDSKPRFQGRLDKIDHLFSRVWQSHEEFSPVRPSLAHRPRSNTYGNETGKKQGLIFVLFYFLHKLSY